MKNAIGEGSIINYVNGTGSAIASGAAVVIGNSIGVAVTDIAVAGTGAVWIDGKAELASVTDAAFAVGDVLLYDTSTNVLTKVASSTTKLAGICTKAKGSSTALGQVKLNDCVQPVAAAVAGLTDSSGGTANGTVQAIGGTFSQSEIANNFADVTAKINAIITNLKAVGLMAS